MADTLSEEKQALIRECLAAGMSYSATGRAVDCGHSTVRRYAERWGKPSGGHAAPAPQLTPFPVTLPDPAPEAGGPGLPEPEYEVYEDYKIDTPGAWAVLSDIHLPYHDKRTIEAAVREAERRNVAGVILNGDTLDFYQISRFSRDPSKPRVKNEIEKGRQLLAWLRSKFPRARLVFKEGNHDERLKNFLSERAPELFDLDDLHLPNLLRAADVGVEWVGDRRVMQLGKLPVIHGHEYQGGGGVMPARWLFIRAWSSALCGHFHQPSHFPVTSLDGREMGVWSTGCACFLNPYYRRKNPWRHGYAMIEVGAGGLFEVTNREVLKDGRVV